MASLNRIIILGRVLNDPDTRLTVEGLPVSKFIINVGSSFSKTEGKIEVVCFGKASEICGQNLKKNANVLVSGRLQVRSFEDQTGSRKWVTEIVASELTLVDSSKPASADAEKVAVAPSDEEEVPELPEDDLPF